MEGGERIEREKSGGRKGKERPEKKLKEGEWMKKMLARLWKRREKEVRL